jgi:hypothetical protein
VEHSRTASRLSRKPLEPGSPAPANAASVRAAARYGRRRVSRFGIAAAAMRTAALGSLAHPHCRNAGAFGSVGASGRGTSGGAGDSGMSGSPGSGSVGGLGDRLGERRSACRDTRNSAESGR